MLVHWKTAGTISVEVLVPDIDVHKKKLVIDGKDYALNGGEYKVTLKNPSPGGKPANFYNKHFCMDAKYIERDGSKEAKTWFTGLGSPREVFGLNRYETPASSVLKKLGPEVIQLKGDPPVFCESVVLQYEAESLTITPPSESGMSVSEYFLVQATVDPQHTGHAHGAKFNELLKVGGQMADLRVTDLKKYEVYRVSDDYIYGFPEALANYLKIKTTSGLDCSPNFLMDPP